MIPRFHFTYDLKDLWSALRGPKDSRIEQDCLRLLGFNREEAHIFLTNRGREAMYVALKCLLLPARARVGVPLYTCSVVAKTVVAAGMTPVFLDADPINLGLSLCDLQKKANRLDCLILVHTCGYPADYDRISELMQGKPVIEDCAHAFGSSYKGRPLGSLGNISFFSFGFFKPLAASGGGCVVTTNATLAAELDIMLGVPMDQSYSEALSHSIRSFLYAQAYRRTSYSVIGYMRGLRSRNGIDGSEGRSDQLSIDPMSLQMRRSDCNVVSSRLHGWKGEGANNAAFWDLVRKNAPEEWTIPPEPDFGEWNHFLLPVQVSSPELCARTIARLRSRGIGAAFLYSDRVAALKTVGYSGDCAQAEQLAGCVFIIPCYDALSLTDHARILDAIRELRRLH